MADLYDTLRTALRSLAWAATLVTTSVLLLSAAGTYALMSFTVAQRTRQIGIRLALGATPQRVMLNVFGRVAWQVSAGVAVGSLLSAGFFVAIGLGALRAMPLLLAVAAIMSLVALLATLGPARRGVRIQAIQALRAEPEAASSRIRRQGSTSGTRARTRRCRRGRAATGCSSGPRGAVPP